MSKLALLGGAPAIKDPLPAFNRIGDAEMREVEKVMRSGELSGFIGAHCDEFYGGPAVRELEERWCETFVCRHAVTMNSNTSGLIAAMGAVGVGPGDEVIVPPYTMSATAIAPIAYGGKTVFVDIEPNYFCLCPKKVVERISEKTKAIVAVNLFGHPAALKELRDIADANGIYLIEDNAQAPLAMEGGRYTGTIGHIGVFSLNRHKHIQCGEGGVCVTDDADLALRLQMIRNHGENLLDPFGLGRSGPLIGFNFRMTELSAAVGIAQLGRAKDIVDERTSLAETLTKHAAGLPGITPPQVRENCTHTYYLWSARFDEEALGVSRDLFCRALSAEGFPNATGYIEPLYRLPTFSDAERESSAAACPVCERMYESELFEFGICSYDPDAPQTRQLIDAFYKVYESIGDLREAGANRSVSQ